MHFATYERDVFCTFHRDKICALRHEGVTISSLPLSTSHVISTPINQDRFLSFVVEHLLHWHQIKRSDNPLLLHLHFIVCVLY